MVVLMKVGRREGVMPLLPIFLLNSKTLHKKNDQKTEVGRSGITLSQLLTYAISKLKTIFGRIAIIHLRLRFLVHSCILEVMEGV